MNVLKCAENITESLSLHFGTLRIDVVMLLAFTEASGETSI